MRFHIDSREERVSQRWVDCEFPHRLERRMKHFLQGCENLLLSRRDLKTLRGNSKGKVQRGQYQVVVGCYRVRQSFTGP